MFLVPLRRPDWGFFDRQRSLFRDMFDLQSMEEEFKEFDRELENMRKAMTCLKDEFGSAEVMKCDGPIVSDKDGNKRLSLRFDCKGFKPEEITVKAVDNRLCVEAKHTEEGPGRKVHREFHKQYVLPDKIDPTTLNSVLASDGVLSIEGPAPEAVEAPKERILPIKLM